MAKDSAKGMTKSQLIAHLAEKSDLTKKQVVALLDELLKVAYKEAKKDAGFTLPGLGKLVVTKRNARMGRNPKTGEPMKIPARKALKFRVNKAAKDSILGAPPAKK